MIRLQFPFKHSLGRTLCALVALVACAVSATDVRAQTPEDPVERVNANLVLLNVGVADRKGQAITNLSQSDFAVYEDGVRQRIASFEPVNAPFSLVLLLDMSGSTLGFRSTIKQSAIRFIDALAPEDRVAVVSFWVKRNKNGGESKIETLADFTQDRRKIAYAISDAGGNGETNLYNGLRFALDKLANEGNRRKAVVVLTDGKDSELERADRRASSRADTAAEALAAVKPEANSQLRSVLDAADRQGVTIYPLALPSGDLKRLAQPLPQQVAIYTSARTRLVELANRTGGRLHEINRLEDLGRLYAEVAADMRTLYSIAYQSSAATTTTTPPRSGAWRAITIEVSRADTIARTRPGYYSR